MTRFFEKNFVHVTASSTGEEAIKNIRQQQYQVVILDINLPGINGWEVLDYIKQYSPNTSVVIVTSSEDELARVCLSEAPNLAVAKPTSAHRSTLIGEGNPILRRHSAHR